MIFRHFDGGVLTQSVKYMQKYSGSEYELKVSRCKKEDAGTYLVIAENSFGKREEKASLKVERKNFYFLEVLEVMIYLNWHKEAGFFCSGYNDCWDFMCS